jgi:hypothetical protein
MCHWECDMCSYPLQLYTLGVWRRPGRAVPTQTSLWPAAAATTGRGGTPG